MIQESMVDTPSCMVSSGVESQRDSAWMWKHCLLNCNWSCIILYETRVVSCLIWWNDAYKFNSKSNICKVRKLNEVKNDICS